VQVSFFADKTTHEQNQLGSLTEPRKISRFADAGQVRNRHFLTM
jgi:hypothetical protein